jgi:RNA polymerase sigma-70 factor (ECF subfamily)
VAGEAEADDLAQETWLRTAESPPRQIETVRAWLRRVLRNAHFEQHRTDARRREREAFATVGVETAALEAPDEVVARAEAQRRMVDALFQLDPASRQLLILRYFQQWTPAQIAASLGEPAGTVRARLSRALARLRERLAKDEGRTQANLLIAGAAGLAKPASSTLPIFAVAAGVCLIALTAGLLLNREKPTDVSMLTEDFGLAAAPRAASIPAAVVSIEETVPEPAIERAPAIAARRAAFTVSGRCVASPTGGPLAGVRLSVHLDNSCWPRRPEMCAQHVQIESQTASDGSFSFAFEPPAAEFRIEWAAEGWVTRHAYWREMPATPVEDFGTVLMDPGLPVTGRVEDEAGLPVAGVFVAVGDMPLPLTPNHVFSDAIGARSGVNGEFDLPVPIPAGVWPVLVSGRGSVLLSPTQFELSGAGQSAPLVVRIRQMPSVQGVCVDGQGTPIAKVRLDGQLVDDQHSSYSVSTQEDGRFAVFARDDSQLASRLKLTAKARGWLDVTEPIECAWGDHGVTIHLQRAPELTIEVLEESTGLPVSDYTVFINQLLESGKTLSPETYAGPHAAGEARCPVQLGKSQVRIAPVSEDYAVPGTELVECTGAAPGVLRFRLVPTARLRVELWSVGAPLSGALIECFLPGSRPMELAASPNLLRSAHANRRPGFPLWPPFKESERTTDALGLVSLPTQPEAGARWLRLTGPFEHFVREVSFDPAALEPLRIEVQAGCRFQGTLLSRWLEWPEFFLILQPEGSAPGWGSSSNELPSYRFPVAKDGRFDLAGIRAGRYDLYLDYDLGAPFPAGSGFRFSPNPTGAAVGTFALQPGLEEPWTFEFPDREPGLLNLTIRLDGSAPQGCVLALFHVDDQSTSLIHSFPFDAEGRLQTDWMTPGRTRADLHRLDANGRVVRAWTGAEEFLVTAAGTTTLNLAFTERRIRIRVLDRDGVTPMPGLKIGIPGGFARSDARTDEDGWYELHGVPVSPVKIVGYPADSEPWHEEISWSQEELDVTRTLIRP